MEAQPFPMEACPWCASRFQHDLECPYRHMETLYVPSEAGSKTTPGTAGAPGRLTHVSEILDPLQIDAFITRDDGLKDYPGRVTGILSRSSEGPGGEYTLTVCFDSLTDSRLRESHFGLPGINATVGVGFSLTMTSGERFTTSPSTSRKSP